jgi:xylan 1,4-beta-xylosidase
MNTNIGVPKPAYRAFEILHQLGDELVAAQGAAPAPGIDCYALRNKSAATVLCSNWLPYTVPGIQTHTVSVQVCGLAAAPAAVSTRTIDDKSGSARPLWEALGSPTYPSAAEIAAMQEASLVLAQPQPVQFVPAAGCAVFAVTLAPYATTATTVEF